jgi:SAM-dependent methyltransferase
MKILEQWLAHPLTKGLDINDPRTTLLRRRIIREKPILNEIYLDWYRSINRSLPNGNYPVLEIGSGASFLHDFISDLIPSDIFLVDGINAVLDGHQLPFKNESLQAIVMTDVFHHLPNPRRFLQEATRCIRQDGSVIMIEPWVTAWSTFIYTKFHHEPFHPEAKGWEFPASGPLSGANGALPWIIFERDRKNFEQEFPQLRIESIKLMMPFIYLASGGISTREIIPGFFYKSLRYLEKLLLPSIQKSAMVAFILLRRIE